MWQSSTLRLTLCSSPQKQDIRWTQQRPQCRRGAGLALFAVVALLLRLQTLLPDSGQGDWLAFATVPRARPPGNPVPGSESPSLLAESSKDLQDVELITRPVEELSGTLYALASKDNEVTGLRRAAPRVFQALEGRSSEMGTREVAQILWSIAVLGEEAPLLSMLVPDLIRRLIARGALLTPAEAAMTMWAVAEMRGEIPHAEVMITQLARRLSEDSEDLSPERVRETFLALNVVRLTDDEVFETTADLLVEQTGKVAKDLSAEAVADIMTSARNLQRKVPQLRRVLPLLLDVVGERAPRMSPSCAARIATAAAALDTVNFAADAADKRILHQLIDRSKRLPAYEGDVAKQIFGRLRPTLLEQASSLSVEEVCNLLLAMEALHHVDSKLIGKLVSRFLVMAPRLPMHLFARHSSRILWALKRLGATSLEVITTVANRFLRGMGAHGDFRFLKQSEIRCLCWVFEEFTVDTVGVMGPAVIKFQSGLHFIIASRLRRGELIVAERWEHLEPEEQVDKMLELIAVASRHVGPDVLLAMDHEVSDPKRLVLKPGVDEMYQNSINIDAYRYELEMWQQMARPSPVDRNLQ